MTNLMTTCPCGADLTQPQAYIYIAGGNRVCRKCATTKMPKPIKRVKDAHN